MKVQIGCFGIAPLLIGLCTMSMRAANATQSETFSVNNAVLTPGTGELILANFAPQYANQGLGASVEVGLDPVVQNLVQELTGDIQVRLSRLNFMPFLQVMANAGGMADRILAPDKETRFRVVSLSLGVSGAANFGLLGAVENLSQQFNNLAQGQAPTASGAVDASVMLGFNLAALHLPRFGFFDPDRLQLFVSGFKLDVGDDATSYAVHVGHLGTYAQYHVVPERQLADRFNFARWGGIGISTGWTRTTQRVAFTATLPGGQAETSYALPNVDQDLTVRYAFSGRGTVGANTSMNTVPFEISTSLQLMYFLTMSAGIAADLSFGHTHLYANASEPTHVVLVDDAGTQLNVLNPQPTLTFTSTASPARWSGRGFFGLQFGIGFAAVYAQAQVDTNHIFGASGGVRLYY